MPNETADGKKAYVVKLPHNMELHVDLASPHPTSLRILFADGNGVQFEYSGEKGKKGTVKPIGAVDVKVLASTGTKRWTPMASSAARLTAVSAAFATSGAFLETGEH